MADYAERGRKPEAAAATGAKGPARASRRHAELLERRSESALGPAKHLLGRRAELSAAEPRPVERARENRTGLPDTLKEGVESLSGYSLDDVRVHRNSARPARLGAHAFAQGSDIHLGPGEERHLPHEAWHVVQQKQKRVRATVQLRGVGANLDSALEREADAMGAVAAAGRYAPLTAPLLSVSAGPSVPVQAVLVYRAGQWVDEEPYVPQPGDQLEEDFNYQPRVLVDQGRAEVRMDEKGKSSVSTRKPPPDHPELQKARERQGGLSRKRLADDPGSIDDQTKKLSDIASELEKQAGKSVPKNHQAKVRKLHQGGDVSGSKFRGVIKAQDEFTQSESSSAYHRGLSRKRGSTPPPVRKKLDAYAEESLRVMSSLRAPTEAIVAPVTHKGVVKGMQHPTKRNQPKLPEGSSGHSFADRGRVQEQIQMFDTLSANPKTPANALFLTTTFKAVQSTLSTMSAPTTASNLPVFNAPRRSDQVQERERIKQQGAILAKEIGLKVSTAKQPKSAPWSALDAPMSPTREDPPSLTAPPTAKTTITPSIVKPPIQKVVEAAAHVQSSAADLLAAIPNTQNALGASARNALTQRVTAVLQAAPLVDMTDGNNLAILHSMHGTLYRLFLSFRNVIRRPLTQHGGGNAGGNSGERIGALRQFFAECAQMAAHNALVLRAHPDLTNQGAVTAIQNEATLGGLGAFQNQSNDIQIRAMLQQPAIPVISNIAQAATILGLVQANNQQQLNNLLISQSERAGATAIGNFITGATQSLVMVINTVAHQFAAGHHWIAVRITRPQNGALRIQFLDSLDQPADYSLLFQAVRAFLAQLPQQPAPQQPQGNSQQGATTTTTVGKNITGS